MWRETPFELRKASREYPPRLLLSLVGNDIVIFMTIDEARKQWRATPCTTLSWEPAPDQTGNAPGECKGEFFRSPTFPYLAYLKPGKIEKPLWQWPLPAYEKIAADLAYDLGCPVPAVQVWDRGDSMIDGYACYCCLSLKEFPQQFAWGLCNPAMTAADSTPIVGELIRAALARASGMLVLDTWIGQGDRGDHPQNIQLSYDPSAPTRAQFTYLDFGRTFDWNGGWSGDGWRQVQITAQPTLLMKALDKRLVSAALANVMGMREETISEICTRLAGRYFTQQQSEAIASGLIDRRDLLKPVLSGYLA